MFSYSLQKKKKKGAHFFQINQNFRFSTHSYKPKCNTEIISYSTFLLKPNFYLQILCLVAHMPYVISKACALDLGTSIPQENE